MKPISSAPSARRLELTRLLGVAALTVLGVALLWKLVLLVVNSTWVIGYPNELDYGEGIVWQQMRMLAAGTAYGPIDGFPSIVFHYPPLYHATTWAVARLGGFDELSTGRAISALSTLVSALVVGLITARLSPDSGRWARMTCGTTAALVALICWPVTSWAPLMRVDMIAGALTLGGFYLAMLSLRRPRLIHLAAVAFVAGVFSKQTMIAAPAAVFGVLLVLRPRLAMAGIATSLGLGLIALATLAVATDGGFQRHVFLYNVNRFDAARIWRGFRAVIGSQAIFVGLAAYGFISCWERLIRIRGDASGWVDLRARMSRDLTAIQTLFAMTYFLLTSAMLILTGKVGANINYFVEWLLVVSIFVGISIDQAARAAFGAGRSGPVANPNYLAVGLIPLAIGLQAWMLPQPTYFRKIQSAKDQAESSQLFAQVRAARRPIISDDMVLLLKNGKQVVWEPAIFAELASMGVYDERPLVHRIRRGAFAFFVTEGERGSELFDKRYNPAVADAMDAAYPRKRKLAGLTVHLPAD